MGIGLCPSEIILGHWAQHRGTLVVGGCGSLPFSTGSPQESRGVTHWKLLKFHMQNLTLD